MGKTHPVIGDSIRKFIERQPVFFVGTAPRDHAGHLNISPKGLNTLCILGPTTVAYLDLTGSGIETAAHLKENGRITLMFCAFDGPPNILRLYGKGAVVEPHNPKFASLLALFPPQEGTRSIIVVEISRISDSCGYGVPRLKYEGGRTQLGDWTRNLGSEGLRAYIAKKNRTSIDGIPGLLETREEQ